MPRVKTTAPAVSREKGQRSIDTDPLYLVRNPPLLLYTPGWVEGEMWREIVRREPFATICRETLTSNLTSLDWKIEPKDSTQRDELRSEIKYYTDFITYTGDIDYVNLVEWIGGDLLDLPFGGGAEMGREGDNPNGRLVWIIPLDGTTLSPYPNNDYPVYQKVKYAPEKVVFFPKHAINRVFMSPRREIIRKGWGMPPPEKIYLSLELLGRGHVYYASLLLDTPEAGILDLGDMAQDSAQKWVADWRKMLTGIDPFKIPVLYEHEKPVNWIPFTRSPADITYDKNIMRYAALCTAGYGMTLSDIGFPSSSSGGDTLAGSIRQERHTRRTGFARFKKLMKGFFDRMLPDTLEFKFIDTDDELSLGMGRARLASATAASQWVALKVFTPEEMRQQAIADGLITISVPESVPDDAEFPDDQQNMNERPGMLGKPVSPSQGGYGEVRSLVDELFNEITLENNPKQAKILDEFYLLDDNIENEEKLIWQDQEVDLEKMLLMEQN